MPKYFLEECSLCGEKLKKLTFWQSINPFYYQSIRCKLCNEAIEEKRNREASNERNKWLKERAKILIGR